MKRLLIVTALLLSSLSFAQSNRGSNLEDYARLRDCGGEVELRSSGDNLHLKFIDVRRCENLIIKKDSYGRVIKQYSFAKGGERAPYTRNYTLSKDMWRELAQDGDLYILVTGRGRRDELTLRVPSATWSNPEKTKCGGHSKTYYTGWALTNNCNCAYYRRGVFQRLARPYEERNCQIK